MLKIENAVTPSLDMLDAVIRGVRNPMNSWDKSDSDFASEWAKEMGISSEYHVGHNDYDLMKRLASAGRSDRKYLRMIAVYLDITAPLYWWKEFDTYKIGTVANSCSTMHKIADKRFEREDFSIEHLENCDEHHWMVCMDNIISALNVAREKYLETKTKPMKEEAKRAPLMKTYWWQMIQLLPSSYNQRRTVMLNYEVLANIYHSRRHHKLDEWHIFCDWIEELPYSELIVVADK